MADVNRKRRVRLEPSVTEEWARMVFDAGHSPNEFSEWLLEQVDLEESLERYKPRESLQDEDQQPLLKPAKEHADSRVSHGRIERSLHPPRGRGWTKPHFFEFLEVVKSVPSLQPSMTLLGAYCRLGPMPTSDDLAKMCGFTDDATWHQALRVAKQGLTLQARKMDATGLFPRAKTGSSGKRLHPMEPSLFAWLKEWGLMQEGVSEDPADAFPDPERWGQSVTKKPD